jgi:diaminohydroxyphosphoribosylaminopyrimidine deaminase/5-amino-6-(5-phosphoribosylamino)uracil reductase
MIEKADQLPTQAAERRRRVSDPMDYMDRALLLARLALVHSSPNPAVGAVIVKDDVIVGEGYTQPPGSAHAEIVALQQAGEKAKGATMYVTLEPCCHQGRTPPCTKAIIAAGIANVHISIIDPDLRVCGRGKSDLEAAGIKTSVGDHEDQAQELNEAYIKHTHTGLPFVIGKFAMSLDGKIATKTGESRWISGEQSRRYVHTLRSQIDSIMVGVDTIIRDDPQLTARAGLVGGRVEKQPLRVIVDSRGRTPPSAKVFQVPGKTMVATTKEADPDRIKALTEVGAEVVELPGKDGMVDLEELLKLLGQRKIVSMMVEGGAAVFGSLFEERLIDKVLAFVAPIVIGGHGAKNPVEGKGVEKLSQATGFTRVKVEMVGSDVLISGYIAR